MMMRDLTNMTVEAYRLLLSVDRDAAADVALGFARRASVTQGRAARLSPDEVDDVEGEVIAAIWESAEGTLREVDADSSLSAWVEGVCHHKVVDRIRARVRDRGARRGGVIQAAQCALRAKSRLARWRRFDAGDRAMLSPRQHRAIDLHVAGRTYAQVASELVIGHHRAIELVNLAWRRLHLAHAHVIGTLHPLLPVEGWERLSPRGRRIAILWNEGHSRREISQIERSTLDAVRGAVSRIRSSLRRREGGPAPVIRGQSQNMILGYLPEAPTLVGRASAPTVGAEGDRCPVLTSPTTSLRSSAGSPPTRRATSSCATPAGPTTSGARSADIPTRTAGRSASRSSARRAGTASR